MKRFAWHHEELNKSWIKKLTITSIINYSLQTFLNKQATIAVTTAGLSPVGGVGWRAPRKMPPNEDPPKDFPISPLSHIRIFNQIKSWRQPCTTVKLTFLFDKRGRLLLFSWKVRFRFSWLSFLLRCSCTTWWRSVSDSLPFIRVCRC